jgi:putative phosphoesterase
MRIRFRANVGIIASGRWRHNTAMRVAALYDIHGNLPALDAVLADVRAASVDAVVVGGDVVPGPMPRQTLDRLMTIDVPVHFIHGNCEVAVLQQMAGLDLPRVPAPFRPIVEWTALQLADWQPRLASWPLSLRLDVEGLGSVLFCHATPRDPDECFTRQTPDARMRVLLGGVRDTLVVCGHTHMQFDRRIDDVRIVNAGSVGMPFAPPGAYWLLLGPGVELRRTEYDVRRAADLIAATAYPDAENTARQVIEPPLERAMLDVFARADDVTTP